MMNKMQWTEMFGLLRALYKRKYNVKDVGASLQCCEEQDGDSIVTAETVYNFYY